jgi:hypothetical protein
MVHQILGLKIPIQSMRIKALGRQLVIHMLHSLIKRIQIEQKVPVEWKKNTIVSIYKNKGDKLVSQL